MSAACWNEDGCVIHLKLFELDTDRQDCMWGHDRRFADGLTGTGRTPSLADMLKRMFTRSNHATLPCFNPIHHLKHTFIHWPTHIQVLCWWVSSEVTGVCKLAVIAVDLAAEATWSYFTNCAFRACIRFTSHLRTRRLNQTIFNFHKWMSSLHYSW